MMSSCERQAGANIALPFKTHNHSVNTLILQDLVFIRVCVSLTVRHVACSSAPVPGSVCTSTDPRGRAVRSDECCRLSAGPRQTATAPQTPGLERGEDVLQVRLQMTHTHSLSWAVLSLTF